MVILAVLLAASDGKALGADTERPLATHVLEAASMKWSESRERFLKLHPVRRELRD
jgi:hypothetical protein